MKLIEIIKGGKNKGGRKNGEQNLLSYASENAELVVHYDTKKIMLIGFSVLLAGFLGFILWAALAPMVNGIAVPGVVSVSSHEYIIQSRYGGTLKTLFVNDGDTVKQKQPLMLLDDSSEKADLAAAKSEYVSYLALEGRLLAEDSFAVRIKFPKGIYRFKNSPQAQSAMLTQSRLFSSYMENYKAEKNIYKSDINGYNSYLSNMKLLKKATKKQITLLRSRIVPLERLAKKGYYPRNRVVDLKSELEGLQGKLNEQRAEAARAFSEKANYELKLGDLKNNFLQRVNMRLSEVQKKIFALKQQYIAYLSKYMHTTVSSPVNGIIVKVFTKTPGSAVLPGEPMIDIMPLNQNLIIKANIPAMDIAHVRKGLSANLRFPAFNMENTPVIDGRVVYISAASLIDRANNKDYYFARIKINTKGLKSLAERNLELKAGMPAMVTVKTGKMTLLEIILKPLARDISNAFVR